MNWREPLGLFTCLLAPALHAMVITAESFNYPDGPLVEVDGGTWTTHSGTVGQVKVVDGSLGLRQSQSEDVSLPFPLGPMTATSAPGLFVKAQVTFNSLPAGHGNYFLHFKDSSPTSGFRCRVFAVTNDAAPGCLRFGIAAGANSPSAVLSRDIPLRTSCTLVCRFDLTNNVSSLWLDPTPGAPPDLTSLDFPTVKGASAVALREALASGSGMGELLVDNLVVATTFAEALRWPSFALAVTQNAVGPIRLEWQADPGQSYSVYSSEQVTDSFQPLATGLWFGDEHGFYEEDGLAPNRFYRVGSP